MPQFLNDVEAAKLLTLSAKTLRTWRQQGKGPAYRKLGGAVRYYEADLIEWADAGRVVPRPRNKEGSDSK
jgi:excisionase family DNA binding protein